MVRVRIRFSKGGLLTYTSHLDLARIWERSLRRARASAAYSRGFSPRPKLQLAAALPLGHTGEAELLDVWLEQPVEAEGLVGALGLALPDGLEVGWVHPVSLEEPALPAQVVSSEYRVVVEWPGEADVEARIGELLAAADLFRERGGKVYDLRPLVERLWLQEAAEGWVVVGMRLAARAGATGRPEAVLEALGMGKAFARYQRQQLLLRALGNDRGIR